jgi:hypothetical protein
MNDIPGVTFSDPNNWDERRKWDLQLSQALINQQRLGEIFAYKRIGSIELKTETWLWQRTGNICIEYRQRGVPSGIAVTTADYWVHELKDDNGETLVYLMFPLPRLKALARHWKAQPGHDKHQGGDRGEYDNIVIPLRAILR